MEVGSLPLELWRVILAYLSLPDLGRCSLVCRAWCELISSLDKTRWRQLFLDWPGCRHPNWPNRPHLEPLSWREALRQHSLASRTWAQSGPDLDASSCLYLFCRRKDRRVWHVGAGREHETLRGALAAAGPYDRVVLHPGIYEEQSEVALKVPVEVLGSGKLGDVTLLVSIDQQCLTARFCNLVLMPSWFSPVIYKTSSGHVQLDSCNMEGGQLQIRGPGTCHARFCAFGLASGARFQSVALSLLDSCDFSGSDTASVTVEGPPTSDRNWAYKHLAALAKTFASMPAGGGQSGRGENGHSRKAPGVSAAHEKWEKEGERKRRRCWEQREEDFGEGAVIKDSRESDLSEEEGEGAGYDGMVIPASAGYKLSHDHHGLTHLLNHSCHSSRSPAPLQLRSLQHELQLDPEAQALFGSIQGCLLRGCLFRDGKGGVLVCNQGQARLEGNVFCGLNYGVRCVQNAKIVMLRNEVRGCRTSGVFLRLSVKGLIAQNDIHSNGEAGLDIRKGANPIVLCNRIHSGQRSGIVVLGNGRGSIRSNRIYHNREAGIYILYNGNPVVSGNHIFQGQAAGIAVNENGKGLIVDNMIEENQWGGVDIRRGGDPILRNNTVRHGYSDGIVLGERGQGLVEGNQIYSNKGCGVWVMSSSLPHLSGNRIFHNGIHGVAVFCHKNGEGGGRGGRGEGDKSLAEEGDLLTWEGDMDGEDIQLPPRRPVTMALLEGNYVGRNRAAGIYIKTSEAFSAIGNMLHDNRGAGVSILQSGPLTHLAANCISHNGRAGVTVDTGCHVELHGNGIYDNRGHGVSSLGEGQIVENDVVGNHGCGIRLLETADIRVLRNRVQPLRGCGIAVLGHVKGMVLENVVFQGDPNSSKPLIYRDPRNNTCLLTHNSLRRRAKSTAQMDAVWTLENPPPRPQPEVQLSSTLQHPITLTNRISHRVARGSIFCSIL